MKQGAVDIVALSSSNMGAFGTAIDFVTMPYVFRSQDEAKKLLYDWLADAMNARTEEEMGIRLVGFVPNCGYRQLMHNADQVIKRPADLDGIKIRVTKSPTEFNLMKGWGATPVPYDWSAVYEGLQSGVVEGMFTSDCFLWDLSFHEVVDHVVQLDGAWNIGVMVMDSERYEALPEWARAAVDAAGRDLTDLYFAQDAAWQEDRRQQLREKTDLETYVPDEAEMDAWRSGAVEAWKAADGRYDKALMRRILEAQSMSAFIADLEDAGVL
jgi:TRAP-type C4-dicarboxylate transport system substrate-binding protein